jgi:hypothetical protein
VSVTISAPQDLIDKVTSKVLRAHVNAGGLGPGRYELPVTASAPEGVSIQMIGPKTVGVEIYNQKKLK